MTTRTRFRMRRMAQKMAAKAILTGQLMQEGGDPAGAQGGGGQGATAQGATAQGAGEREEPDQALARTPEKQANVDASQKPQVPNPPGESGYVQPMSGMGGQGRGSQQPRWSDVR